VYNNTPVIAMSFCDLVLEKCYQFSLTQEGVTW